MESPTMKNEFRGFLHIEDGKMSNLIRVSNFKNLATDETGILFIFRNSGDSVSAVPIGMVFDTEKVVETFREFSMEEKKLMIRNHEMKMEDFPVFTGLTLHVEENELVTKNADGVVVDPFPIEGSLSYNTLENGDTIPEETFRDKVVLTLVVFFSQFVDKSTATFNDVLQDVVSSFSMLRMQCEDEKLLTAVYNLINAIVINGKINWSYQLFPETELECSRFGVLPFKMTTEEIERKISCPDGVLLLNVVESLFYLTQFDDEDVSEIIDRAVVSSKQGTKRTRVIRFGAKM